MLLAFTTLDYAVLGVYMLAMLLIGWYFSRQQHTSKDFFLAGRSMGWFPVGLSTMATLLSALSYTGVPSEASKVGFLLLAQPLGACLTLPIMLLLVIPIFHRLEIFSIYEYLEFRFNLAVRIAASAVRGMVLALDRGVLYAPCKVMAVASGLHEQLPLFIILLGAVGTSYTFMGGMKAVIWTDVIQSLVMYAGLIIIALGVWYAMPGGAAEVWNLGEKFGQTTVFQWQPSSPDGFWTDKFLVWGILPHMFLAHMSFYTADQITAQRFLTTRSMRDVRQSFILNLAAMSVLVAGLAYVGIALSAFYFTKPQQLNPYWVVHLATDPTSNSPLIEPATGRPWVERTTDIAARLPELVTAGAILDPNTGAPFASTAALLDDEGRLQVERLAKRNPATEEILLQRGSDELLPRFIVRMLPSGIAGIILAALLAASMSSMDSGLNAISTLGICDFYRRLRWGRTMVARLRRKREDQLDDTDELWLGRWMVLLIGIVATLFSLWVSRLESIFDIMISVCNTFGVPLLGLFMLGMLTRRCNATAALIALVVGTPLTVWFAFGWRVGLWPLDTVPNPIWSVTLGVASTMLLGYGLSFVIGHRPTARQLEGLVAGVGKLGERSEADVSRAS